MKHLTLSPYRAGLKVWISIPRTNDIEHRAVAGMLFAERSQYYCWGEEQPGHRIGLEAMIRASEIAGFFKDLQELHKLRPGVLVSFHATDCP
jgi:hypothetical protein